jgi:glycosyltransferase involved in cell wall biosynthesis
MDAVVPWPAKLLTLPSEMIFGSLFKSADAVVSASLDYIKNSKLAAFYALNQDKFAEVPYPVDTDRFHPGPAPEGVFRIMFVGGLDRAHYFKGISVLLEAAARLRQEGRDFVLDIVGDGDLKETYEERAEELGIGGHVVFSGSVADDDLPAKYRQASTVVLPSINKGEAFGIVLTEAMASGVPVIASDLPGVRSVFIDGREGLACRPGDVFSLKDKLKAMMDDPVRRAEMARAARASALAKYSYAAAGQNFAAVVKKASQ